MIRQRREIAIFGIDEVNTFLYIPVFPHHQIVAQEIVKPNLFDEI